MRPANRSPLLWGSDVNVFNPEREFKGDEIWDDMVHVFHGYAPFLPEANEAIDKIGLFISDK